MAGGITVTIRGLDDLRRKLGSGRIEGPVNRFLDRGAIFVQGEARRHAPTDTGRLRNSIGIQSPSNRARRIGPNTSYARFVEEGTRPHWPPPGALAGWAGRHGLTDYQARRAIAMHGTKAQPYMQPAAEAAEGQIRSFVPLLAAEIEAAYQGG